MRTKWNIQREETEKRLKTFSMRGWDGTVAMELTEKTSEKRNNGQTDCG